MPLPSSASRVGTAARPTAVKGKRTGRLVAAELRLRSLLLQYSAQVYLSLIKMYLSPPDLVSYGIRLPEGSLPEANVEDALKVLTAHHHLVDSTKV